MGFDFFVLMPTCNVSYVHVLSNITRITKIIILYQGNLDLVVIVAFLENATIGYSLESLSLSVCVCFLHEKSI